MSVKHPVNSWPALQTLRHQNGKLGAVIDAAETEAERVQIGGTARALRSQPPLTGTLSRWGFGIHKAQRARDSGCSCSSRRGMRAVMRLGTAARYAWL